MVNKTGEEPRREEEKTVQQRAVEYGAKDVEPERRGKILQWPADEEKVALDKITYSEEEDTFAGWSGAGSEAQWVQK